MHDVATDALQREHEALLHFLYLCPVGVIQTDRVGNVSMMNPVANQLLMPLARRGSIDNLLEALDPWAPTLRNLIYDFADGRGAICENLRIAVEPSAGNRPRKRVLSLSLIRVDRERLQAVLVDVTDVVRQERELQDKEAHLRAIFDSVREFALYTLDLDGRVLNWNRSGHRLTGYEADDVLGRHFSLFYPADTDPGQLRDILERARSTGWNEDESERLRKDGSRFWASTLTTVLLDDDGNLRGFTRVSRDLTAQRRAEQELREMARTDHLTGVPNRRYLCEMAETEVARWRRHDRPLSILCMDIDKFKTVNDTYGHAAGDRVLREFAAACKAQLRDVDLLGRFGGEEFLAVLPDTQAAQAAEVAERVRRHVESLSVRSDEHDIRVTVSVGVAEMCEAFGDFSGLTAAADARMYRAKTGGRNRVVVD